MANNRKQISILILALSLFASSCSTDVLIEDTYTIYDLGGSNQAIIGEHGAVSVNHITAYKHEERRILFEDNSYIFGDVEESIGTGVCQYGYIDLDENSVVYAETSSSLSSAIKDSLMASAESVTSTSCLENT